MGLSKRQKRMRIKPPRVKRMKRSARLQSAKNWLPKHEGKNVLKGYCKHYGVDWRCASIELRQLGVKLDEDYLKQRERSEQNENASGKAKKGKRANATTETNDPCYGSMLEAYLEKDYAALFAMECERDGIEFE